MPGAETLAVIVTGESMDNRSRGRGNGGRVRHLRTLADRRSGRDHTGRPAGALAATDGIRSVVQDKTVSSSTVLSGKKDDPTATDRSTVVRDYQEQFVSPQEIWNLAYASAIDIGADNVHSAGFSGQGVTVAVIDSGVNTGWEAIAYQNLDTGRFAGQADFVGPEVNCRMWSGATVSKRTK